MPNPAIPLLVLLFLLIVALIWIRLDLSERVAYRATACSCGATSLGWEGPWWVMAWTSLFVLGRACSPRGRDHGIEEFQFTDL